MNEALEHVAILEVAFGMLEDGPIVKNTLAAPCRTVPAAGRDVHDANIVATMLAQGERRLSTFNGRGCCRHGNRIEPFDLEADS